MGQTLSEPVVDKRSGYGENERLVYGISDMQGWRVTMEDAHTTELELQKGLKDTSFFGVYDGHGGERVALYTGENLHKILVKEEAFTKRNYKEALQNTFLDIDRALLRDKRYDEDPSGCTATTVLITSDNHIFTANAGDSRTVLGSKGEAIPLSFDHKPSNEEEKARICAAGGFVDFGRVNGNLALSRAIGDFEFKKVESLPPESQIVTSLPDVSEHEITENDEFIVLACDGIWDCQSSEAVVQFVRRGIAARQDLDKICENLMDNCVAPSSDTGGLGCDNMTVIIVGLLQGKTKGEWYDMVAKRVENGDGPCAPPRFAEFKGPGYSHFAAGEENHADTANDDAQNRFFVQRLLDARNSSGNVIRLGDFNNVFLDGHEEDDNEEDSHDTHSHADSRPQAENNSGSEKADLAQQ